MLNTPTTRIRVLSWLALILSVWLGHAASLENIYRLGHGANLLTLDTNGALLQWEGRIAQQTSPAVAGEVRYSGKVLKLSNPRSVARDRSALAFTYRWPEEPLLEVTIHHTLMHANGAWTWTRQVQIRRQGKLSSDLTVSLESGLPALPTNSWLPLINGIGAPLGTNQAAAYRFAGTLPAAGTRLALPLVSVPAQSLSAHPRSERLTLASDIYFSTLFTSTSLEWTYPAAVGLEHGTEQRTIVLSSHAGSVERSLDCFFRTVLSDVAPGPRWLHEIALVDYDYMSDEGQGWFHDIDALCAAIPKADRHQVLLCCHGWYDYLGRYCFDSTTGKLDREWTAFPSYEAARTAHPFGDIGGERVPMGFGNCKPVPMSLQKVHARLAYARSRGFHVGLYFADGMNAGEGLEDYDPSRVLRRGGWQGPDSKGKSYFQNPCHPKVQAFYLNYTRALLNEFGPDVDMLNWDETFHIPAGQLGNAGAPGYADRAMMGLVRDVTHLVEDYNRSHNRQIAFLTSDCLGAFKDELSGPYALVAHGTYQDSWCQPKAWSYGLFSNYRNVLWSCCWWPIAKWSWIDFAVHNYQAPVSLSNGWGNDTGFAEMTPEQRARAIALFNWRKGQPTRLKWFEQLPVYQK